MAWLFRGFVVCNHEREYSNAEELNTESISSRGPSYTVQWCTRIEIVSHGGRAGRRGACTAQDTTLRLLHCEYVGVLTVYQVHVRVWHRRNMQATRDLDP